MSRESKHDIWVGPAAAVVQEGPELPAPPHDPPAHQLHHHQLHEQTGQPVLQQ